MPSKKVKFIKYFLLATFFSLLLLICVAGYFLYQLKDIAQDLKRTFIPSGVSRVNMSQLKVGDLQYFSKGCSVFTIKQVAGKESLVNIFSVPKQFMGTCKNLEDGFSYDGEYIVLKVCQMAFGAGGCGGGRYRYRISNGNSGDHWEEYIGVTWRNGEEYEAWRRVGSTSSRADSIKKR